MFSLIVITGSLISSFKTTVVVFSELIVYVLNVLHMILKTLKSFKFANIIFNLLETNLT